MLVYSCYIIRVITEWWEASLCTQSLPIVARRYAQWCRSLAFIHSSSAPQNGRSYANFSMLWRAWSVVQDIRAANASVMLNCTLWFWNRLSAHLANNNIDDNCTKWLPLHCTCIWVKKDQKGDMVFTISRQANNVTKTYIPVIYRVAQYKPEYLLLLSKFCICIIKRVSVIIYV